MHSYVSHHAEQTQVQDGGGKGGDGGRVAWGPGPAGGSLGAVGEMIISKVQAGCSLTTSSLPGLSLTSRKVHLVAASTRSKRESLLSLLRSSQI